jgi:adenylate kinase
MTSVNLSNIIYNILNNFNKINNKDKKREIPVYDYREGKYGAIADVNTLKDVDTFYRVSDTQKYYPINKPVMWENGLHGGVLVNERNKKVIYYH